MYYIVDRIEENIVVCENVNTKEIVSIEISNLPNGIKKGQVIKYINQKYEIDKEETEKRKQIIHEKTKNLWK